MSLKAGERVAFVQEGHVCTAVWPNVKRKVEIGQGQNIALSPDGKLVAYETNTTGGNGVFAVADAITGKVLRKHPGTHPTFSASGRFLAFTDFVKERWTAHLTDTATLKKTRSLESTGAMWVQDWAGEQVIADSFNEPALCALSTEGRLVKKFPYRQIFGKRTALLGRLVCSSDLNRLLYLNYTEEPLKSDPRSKVTGLFLLEFATGRLRPVSPAGLQVGGAGHHWYDRRSVTFLGIPNTKNILPASAYLLDLTTGKATKLMDDVTEFTVGYRDSG